MLNATSDLGTSIVNLNCSSIIKTIPEAEEYVEILDNIMKTLNSSEFVIDTKQIEDFQAGLNDGFLSYEEQANALLKDIDSIVLLVYTLGGVIIIIIAAIQLIGALLAWFQRTHRCLVCCTEYIFMPILTLVGLVSVVFASAVVFFLVSLSDACTAPGSLIEDIMSNENITGAPAAVIKYYFVDGCKSEDPYPISKSIGDAIASVDETVNQALTEASNVDLSLFCEGWDSVSKSLIATQKEFNEVTAITLETTEYTNCELLNPFYVDLILDGTCDKIPTFFSWTFVTLTVVWISCLFMLLYRSALQPNKKYGSL